MQRSRIPLTLILAMFPAGAVMADPLQVDLGRTVLRTLNENPTVLSLKENIAESRGFSRTATGKFDWSAFSRVSAEEDKLPVSPADQAARQAELDRQNQQIDLINANLGSALPPATAPLGTSFTERRRGVTAGLRKQARSGIVFLPSFSVLDFEDGRTILTPASRSDVNMTVVVPLMRGLGREVAGANELAARNNLQATELQTYHDISEQVLNSVVAYYNCLAAAQSLALSDDIFKRAESLLEGARVMISAGMLEPAFMKQAQAKVDNNRADLIAGQNAFHTARQNLGLAMGLSPSELREPPVAVGDFPPVLDPERLPPLAPPSFLEGAMQRRFDSQALQTLVHTEEILLKRDRNSTKSRVDLSLRAGYAGVSESGSGFSRPFRSLTDQLEGLNGGAVVDMDFPVQNNVAMGLVDSRMASLRRAQQDVLALRNGITSSVLASRESMKNAASQYLLVGRAAGAYKEAVEFERSKYSAGLSSLNLLIDQEDRYVRTRLAVVEALRRYAVAQAQLQFSAGSLIQRRGDELTFRVEDLIQGFE